MSVATRKGRKRGNDKTFWYEGTLTDTSKGWLLNFKGDDLSRLSRRVATFCVDMCKGCWLWFGTVMRSTSLVLPPNMFAHVLVFDELQWSKNSSVKCAVVHDRFNQTNAQEASLHRPGYPCTSERRPVGAGVFGDGSQGNGYPLVIITLVRYMRKPNLDS